jgi:HK97 family phage portal protein
MGLNGTLYSLVDLIAASTSSVDWHLYRKQKPGASKGERVEVTSHLALDVWNRPNNFFTQQLFIQTFQQHKELVGEFWWVVSHNMFGWPESIWVVRPDRMYPVPSAKEGLTGYIYVSPDGEQVPLALNEVIRARSPNPLDPGPAGRGMGAVQSILATLDSARYSAEWNRNFFMNSAVPGGIIEVPDSLDDTDFDRLRMQWGEQHRGVSAAGRVGILEGGAKWVDGSSTHDDMQFAELTSVDEGLIRKAFRIHPHMLGDSDDVNLANAQAADYTFAQWTSKLRLDVIRDVLNTDFLPQFGPFGHGTGQPDVEFDYDSPVPEDQEAADKRTEVQAKAANLLVAAGYEPSDVLLTLGMAPMRYVGPPKAPAVPASTTNPDEAPVGGAK